MKISVHFFLVDENPSPLVSKFNFTPKIGNASLTTRVRIDKYTYVRAVVEMNNCISSKNSFGLHFLP